jgi:hypothetical protein
VEVFLSIASVGIPFELVWRMFAHFNGLGSLSKTTQKTQECGSSAPNAERAESQPSAVDADGAGTTVEWLRFSGAGGGLTVRTEK